MSIIDRVTTEPQLGRLDPAERAVPGVRGGYDAPVVEFVDCARAAGRDIHLRCWTSLDQQSGTPVVLIHGLGVGSRMCRPVAERLARRRLVVAPDLPGFGRSPADPDEILDPVAHADVVAAWIRSSGMPPPLVVGTSIGAQVAAEVAARHPDVCRAVVLASPTVERGRRSWRTQLTGWAVEQTMQSPRFRLLMAVEYAHCGIRRAARTFALAMEHRVEDTVTGITRPVLVCRGTRDPLLSARWVRELVERAPHGELRTLPGAVHNLSHESPVEFARCLEAYLDGLDRSEGSR